MNSVFYPLDLKLARVIWKIVFPIGIGSEGVIGRGLSFDGYDDDVEIQNYTISGFEYELGSLSEGTISLWFKLNSFPEKILYIPFFILEMTGPIRPHIPITRA